MPNELDLSLLDYCASNQLVNFFLSIHAHKQNALEVVDIRRVQNAHNLHY